MIFYEALAYYSHGQTKNLIGLINEKKLGKIISINSTFGFKVKRINPKSRIFDKSLGGGSILDIGCYPLSLLNLFFKNNESIKFKNAKFTPREFYHFLLEPKLTTNDFHDIINIIYELIYKSTK